jgi:selenocysteine lyase/cysteine desulfurase
MNRHGSEDFRRLVEYEPVYRSGAARYDVGEHSNFILVPMLTAAMERILAWGPANIQAYCRQLTAPLIEYLLEGGYWVEDSRWRGEHLLGLRLPPGADMATLQKLLVQRQVLVSVRGDSVRVSPHLYNDERDIAALLEVLEAFGKG